MKKHLICICALVFASPAAAALKAGDTAPMFKAKASLNGQAFDYSLEEAVASGPVVIYFYPSAYTKGCNVQAYQFASQMEAFKAAGATVIGVSLDSIDRLNDFSADPEYCAGKLAVASDADGSIAKAYDLQVSEGRAGLSDTRGVSIDHGFAERTTFIVGGDGKILQTIGGVSPIENVQQTLEAVQNLHHE
jgi:thioredoxin-dependent peroxiredoxin